MADVGALECAQQPALPLPQNGSADRRTGCGSAADWSPLRRSRGPRCSGLIGSAATASLGRSSGRGLAAGYQGADPPLMNPRHCRRPAEQCWNINLQAAPRFHHADTCTARFRSPTVIGRAARDHLTISGASTASRKIRSAPPRSRRDIWCARSARAVSRGAISLMGHFYVEGYPKRVSGTRPARRLPGPERRQSRWAEGEDHACDGRGDEALCG